MPQAGFNVRLLSAGPFVTMTDRFAVAPMLIPIAIDFHAPVGAVAIAATAYYLAYGLAQPFWGFASDRAGRIKVIRISLGATAAACTLSAIAPNLDFLIAARIIAGASVCAVLPTALVYIGDVIPFNRRHALIAATYGAAVLAGTRVIKRVASRIPAWVPICVGGAMGVVGYLTAAADQHAVAILFASVMIGGCYAIFHSTMQAWATDIAPEARGTAAALFVTSAFTGGAIGSGLGALFAQQHQYGRLFLAAAALSVPVVTIAALTRARYPGSTLAEQVGEVAGS